MQSTAHAATRRVLAVTHVVDSKDTPGAMLAAWQARLHAGQV
jgi:hypothetical protein